MKKILCVILLFVSLSCLVLPFINFNFGCSSVSASADEHSAYYEYFDKIEESFSSSNYPFIFDRFTNSLVFSLNIFPFYYNDYSEVISPFPILFGVGYDYNLNGDVIFTNVMDFADRCLSGFRVYPAYGYYDDDETSLIGYRNYYDGDDTTYRLTYNHRPVFEVASLNSAGSYSNFMIYFSYEIRNRGNNSVVPMVRTDELYYDDYSQLSGYVEIPFNKFSYVVTSNDSNNDSWYSSSLFFEDCPYYIRLSYRAYYNIEFKSSPIALVSQHQANILGSSWFYTEQAQSILWEATEKSYLYGKTDGYNDGLSMAGVTPFSSIADGFNSLMNISLFGTSVTFGTILSMMFGLILLGVCIKIFLGG